MESNKETIEDVDKLGFTTDVEGVSEDAEN